MKTTSVLTLSAISSLAAALDVEVYATTQCYGSTYATCSNLPANTCCSVISGNMGAGSANFYNLPGQSYINGFQNTPDGNNCGSLAVQYETDGNYCISIDPDQGEFAGVNWSPAGASKFRVRATAEESTKCVASVAPDLIVGADGTKYDTRGMSNKQIGELWNSVVVNGTTK